MLKEFMLRQMMKRQLKDVPEAEQEKLIKLVSENPDLFQKIAEKAQAKIRGGKDQMSAIMEAASEHQEELKKIVGSN